MVNPPRFTVATAGGPRTVEFVAGESPGLARASVDMGPVTLGPDRPAGAEAERALTADVGNPHLVLLVHDVASVSPAESGPPLQASFAEGVNVEWITLEADRDGPLLGLRCGSAAPVNPGLWHRQRGRRRRGPRWELVTGPGPVRVRNPGGTLEVLLGPADGDPAFLAGPVRKIADIDIDPGLLS